MKLLGILLLTLAFCAGIASEKLPRHVDARPVVLVAFLIFLLGIYALILDRNETPGI